MKKTFFITIQNFDSDGNSDRRRSYKTQADTLAEALSQPVDQKEHSLPDHVYEIHRISVWV